MRTILRLMYPPAFVGIALVFLTSSVSCLNSPFLGGPRGEARLALVLFWSRTLACGLALWVLLSQRKRLWRHEPGKLEL
jgi:hypothetical protein